MKTTALFLAFLFTITLQAQDVLHFKVRYNENTTYSQEIETKSDVSMLFEAEPEILEALEEQGVANPTITNDKSKIASVMTTGKLKGDTMPVTLMLDLGEKIPGYTEKIMVYGTVTKAGPPKLESVDAPGLGDDFATSFLTTIQSMLEQVKMPDATLKIGESFKQSMPITLPIGPVTMNMTNNITYTLKSIKGHKSYFDIVYDFTMNANVDAEGGDAKGTGTGKGTGTLEFDSNESFITSMDNDLNMDFTYKADKMGLSIKLETTQSTKAVIRHN